MRPQNIFVRHNVWWHQWHKFLRITAPKALRRCYMTNTVYLTLTLDYMWITAHCHCQCHGSHHSLQEMSHCTGNTKKILKKFQLARLLVSWRVPDVTSLFFSYAIWHIRLSFLMLIIRPNAGNLCDNGQTVWYSVTPAWERTGRQWNKVKRYPKKRAVNGPVMWLWVTTSPKEHHKELRIE